MHAHLKITKQRNEITT